MNKNVTNNFGVELTPEEMVNVNGGIFPIVVLGVTISAKAAAAITAGSIFAAGVYVGYQEGQDND